MSVLILIVKLSILIIIYIRLNVLILVVIKVLIKWKGSIKMGIGFVMKIVFLK
jgi:hypothetical protein